ncbi:MAG TPA: type II secretion system F family protein [Chloroflexota bacterium]|jgi:tight adherence protein B
MPFAVAPTVLASSAVFVTILLFGLGVYRIANHGGILARRRVSVFAPARSKAAAADMPGNAPLLLHPPRFSNISILDNLLRRKGRGARLSLKLARAALPMRVGEYLLVRCAVALVLGALAGRALGALVPAVAAGLGGYFLPVLYVRARQKKRVRAFDDQLVDALVLMSNSLKTGYSFMQAMESIVREMPEPIGVEFDQALREIRMGGAIEDALLGISERVRSTDFELVVTAMVIQRQVGGNLTEILSNIAYTIRERHRILREVRVLTAQERMSGYIVAGLPVAMVVLLSLLSPSYISSMWAATSGRVIMGVGFVLELLGLLVIRKLVDIEV